MAVILDLAVQGAQMTLVLSFAPLLTGFVRKVKARLLRRQGPPVLQPYRDMIRLLRKEVVLAHNASWLFRVAPYLIFAATWVAAALVPTFAMGLHFSWSADLIAITALIGSARFFLALAGMDVGTSFGGIGSSREVMIASLAEPAMIMITFTVALVAGSTQLSNIAAFMLSPQAGLSVSLGLALVALIIVSIAENARVPVDNPATHLELTMVHEAMVLEYSGRHLAMIEFAASLKLLLYISLIACIFVPWGLAAPAAGPTALTVGLAAYVAKLAGGGFLSAFSRRQSPRCACSACRNSSVPPSCWGSSPACSSSWCRPMIGTFALDVAHLLAGGLVLISLTMLYQRRLYALLNVFALHALILALSVAWQAYIQNAPHLFITAGIALVFKAS